MTNVPEKLNGKLATLIYVLFECEFGIKMSPSIFRFIFMCSASCVLCCAGSGAKNVHVVLSAFRMRLFICVHVYISLM